MKCRHCYAALEHDFLDLGFAPPSNAYLTTNALKAELPENCLALVVKNVLVSTSAITTLFYPDSINDNFDETASTINDSGFKDKVSFGKNVLKGFGIKGFV